MQIVCISRGSYSKGMEVAGVLARKLGCRCVSREDLVEEAIRHGIAVGKLEMAILKPHIFNERLAVEKEHYHAFSAMYLLERALEGGIVYHGRAGHLLLPGITHILRVRVVADLKYRINDVMVRLNLSYEKAKKYIEDTDEDLRRWVRMYYGAELEGAAQYDLTFNLEQMSLENAATALCAISQLPDFQVTPASRRAIENMLLAARARVALAENERTHGATFKVKSDKGVVSVMYQLQDAHLADGIQQVVEKVSGVNEVVCTRAQASILWVQEKFDPESEAFRNVLSVANKWDAAVELMRLDAVDTEEQSERVVHYPRLPVAPAVRTRMNIESIPRNGGIEDDVENEPERGEDGGLGKTITELTRLGHSGGGRSLRTTPNRFVESIDRTAGYNLLVVGDVFLSKGHAVRTRMLNEFNSLLQEKLKSPVVSANELKQQYLFGPRQLINMLTFAALTALIYFGVFTHQAEVLEFLHGATIKSKIIGSVSIFIFVPFIAYIYGTVAHLFLKMLRIE